MGYANPVIHLPFPELTGNPDDPVWVVIRNPKVLPADELMSSFSASTGGTGVDEDGKVTDRKAVTESMRATVAKLVIGARVYDATYQPPFDPLTGKVAEDAPVAPLLPQPPWTPEIARKIPSAITMKISETISEALNPTKTETTQTS